MFSRKVINLKQLKKLAKVQNGVIFLYELSDKIGGNDNQ